MERNIILAGVGGQGILTIAYVLDNAAQEMGLHFKQAEVHGMAQRGGAVQSHLRIADHAVLSDLVPIGKADLVLGVEPLETLRYVHYLSPAGSAVTSDNPHVNIPDYPELDGLYRRYEELPRSVLVDARALARRAGSARAENTVMIGAAAPELGFPYELLERILVRMFARKGEKIVETNLRAFRFGLAAGEAHRAARQAGLSLAAARLLAARLDPDGLEPAALQPWLPLLGGPHAPLVAAALARRDSVIPASRSTELAQAVAAAGGDEQAIGQALES